MPAKDLTAFFVWVPELRATESDVPYGIALVPDARVRNYWDPNESLGNGYDRLLGVGGPAWDVYFLYARGARWDGSLPPRPDFWMHQLAVTTAPRLDPDVFRRRVEQLLAR